MFKRQKVRNMHPKHPPSKARRIAALLPQIEAAMAQGSPRAHIVTALLDVGIEVTPHQLSNVIARDDVGARAPLSHGRLDLRQQRRDAASLRRRVLGRASFEAGREGVRSHWTAVHEGRLRAGCGCLGCMLRTFCRLNIQTVQEKCVPRHYR